MKQQIRNAAERLCNLDGVRVLVRLALWSASMAGRGWSFVRVRAVLSVPAGTACHWRVEFKYPQNIRLLGPVTIGPQCTLGAKAPITLGAQVRLSKGVMIETASLDLNSGLPYRHIAKPIVIEDGVWLGAYAIVLGGVRIGANAVIGAGAVISEDVPVGAVIVGAGTHRIERKLHYGA